jgi:flavin reductase (DIM6/NTAB) family NADH-FMN oxidoreductase RutF
MRFDFAELPSAERDKLLVVPRPIALATTQDAEGRPTPRRSASSTCSPRSRRSWCPASG